MNPCTQKRSVGNFSTLSATRATFGAVNACTLNLRGASVFAIEGPYLIDALEVFNAGPAGVVVATNPASGAAKLIEFIESRVVDGSPITGLLPQLVDYRPTTGNVLVGTLATGFTAFADADQGASLSYQKQITPTHRETFDSATGAVVETNVWQPGEDLVAVYTGGGGTSFTGGSYQIWLSTTSPAYDFTPV